MTKNASWKARRSSNARGDLGGGFRKRMLDGGKTNIAKARQPTIRVAQPKPMVDWRRRKTVGKMMPPIYLIFSSTIEEQSGFRGERGVTDQLSHQRP